MAGDLFTSKTCFDKLWNSKDVKRLCIMKKKETRMFSNPSTLIKNNSIVLRHICQPLGILICPIFSANSFSEKANFQLMLGFQVNNASE